MDRFHFVWNAATSYVKLTLSLQDVKFPINANSEPKKQIMEWISRIGWEKLSCMDESIFMMEKEREEWNVEREESPNDWLDFFSGISSMYQMSIEAGNPTNLIWDHILSVCLVTWESQEEGNSIKAIAGTVDSKLEGDNRHIKESIRALKRIRLVEQDPEADTKIGEGEGDTNDGVSQDSEVDDEVLLGLQSKMKEMMSKIQDPNSGLGKLMMEIMSELKEEKLELDPKSLMDVCMKSMLGGGGLGKMDELKDGPLGKIMSIVQNKIKAKLADGGVDELKNLLESTKELFGNDPKEMKETLMKLLQSMVKKMGIPRQAQNLIFGKMNSIIEEMSKKFVNQDGPAPNQEQMQSMLSESMNNMMKDLMSSQGQSMSARKMKRMAPRMQSRRDPRLERLEKLRERLRKKHEANQKKKKGDK